MLRLASGEHEFQMDLLSVEDDAMVSVRVMSYGYAGHSEVWVHKEALVGFCTGLAQLERSLRGEVAIESMSPGELNVKVLSVSSRGHLAIQGSIGTYVQAENGTYWHAASFGFEFESSELSRAVNESWVRRHVG